MSRQKGAGKKSGKRVASEYYEAILVAVIFASFVKVFIFQTYSIPTPSMVPTIQVGDHLIVNKFSHRTPGAGPLEKLLPFSKAIQRGDIVAFKGIEDPNVLLVKRVVGLPGETIAGTGKRIYIDGRPLDDPAANYSEAPLFRPAFGPLKIPEESYFLMGDNRDMSHDSRAWGVVPGEKVIGTPWYIYWSYEADPYNPEATLFEKTLKLGKVVLTFFTKTRWERTLTIPR